MYIFQLRDVTIEGYDSRKFTDQDKNKEFSKTLERFPLRFSFQDGIVESVCPDIDDIMWAVNIKKGVLSAFQNSMDNFEIEHKGKEVGSLYDQFEKARGFLCNFSYFFFHLSF